MADNHPITPPPELVDQWVALWQDRETTIPYTMWFTQSARWGADQELEACVNWVSEYCPYFGDCPLPEDKLRAARRPKSPSLKEQALAALEALPTPAGQVTTDRLDTIRRALEALDD